MGKTSFIVMLLIFNLIFIAFIGAIIIFIRQYKIKKNTHIKQVLGLEETHKQEIIENQLEIQTHTMKHIGREIHDNIGQKLTLASIYVQQLEYENKAPQINNRIKTISEIINQSLIDLRQLSKSLTDDSIKNNTLFDLLKNECDKIKDLKECHIHFKGDRNINIKSYQKKSILFRVAQEFLQNSIKHSNCKNISISLQKEDTTLLLVLKDDGKGFNVKNLKSNGIGLKNMRNRTKLVGGTFKLESEKSLGTKLTIEILE